MAKSDEQRNVRIATIIFDQLIDVDNDGKKDGRCSFKGHIGDFLTMVIEPTRKYTNCSIDAYHGSLGAYNHTTKLYDGALGLVQTGQADVVPIPVYYPLHDPENEYFDYSNPLREDQLMIACAYNSSIHSKESDIMQMFASVDMDLWWATIAGFVTFILLLNLGYKLLDVSSKYKSPAWMVTCAFLFEDNFPDDTPFNKMINFTACIFLFFFGGYLLNSMQSDLVVYDSPEVISSYQDIFDRIAQGRKLQLVFAAGLPEVEQFRDAPTDSLLGRLWELRLEISDDSVNAMGWFFRLAKSVVDQTAVTIMRETLVQTLSAWALVKVADVDDFRAMKALLSIDREHLIKYTNVMVFNKKLDPVSKGQIIIMAQRIQESGINEFMFQNLYQSVTQGKGFMHMVARASSQIEQPEAALPVIGLRNTELFFKIMGGMVAFSTLVLVMEILLSRRRILWDVLKDGLEHIPRPEWGLTWFTRRRRRKVAPRKVVVSRKQKSAIEEH